jgi:hypothetical protein
MTAFFVCSFNYVNENDDVDDNTTKYVETMETSNEEEEVCKYR